MEQNNQNMMGDAHCVGGSKKKKTIVGNLILLLVVLTGVANLGTNSLVKYYNNVAKTTYNELFTDKWNKFVGMAQKEDTTYLELATEIKSNLVPAIDAKIKIVSETTAPSFAEEYHNTLKKDLVELKTKTESLLVALNNGEEPVVRQKFEELAPIAPRIEKNILAFRDKLAKEKNIEFEKDPTVK